MGRGSTVGGRYSAARCDGARFAARGAELAALRHRGQARSPIGQFGQRRVPQRRILIRLLIDGELDLTFSAAVDDIRRAQKQAKNDQREAKYQEFTQVRHLAKSTRLRILFPVNCYIHHFDAFL